MQPIQAIDLAKYILTLLSNNKLLMQNEEMIELTSRMKLLKLLYYVQGYHLGMFNKPLFIQDIQALKHGPIVAEVYTWLKEHDDKWLNEQLLNDEEISKLELLDSQKELINDVLKIYNKYSAYGLRDKTHKEEPFLQYYFPGQNVVIPKEFIANFFKPLIVEN